MQQLSQTCNILTGKKCSIKDCSDATTHFHCYDSQCYKHCFLGPQMDRLQNINSHIKTAHNEIHHILLQQRIDVLFYQMQNQRNLNKLDDQFFVR